MVQEKNMEPKMFCDFWGHIYYYSEISSFIKPTMYNVHTEDERKAGTKGTQSIKDLIKFVVARVLISFFNHYEKSLF